MLLAGACLLAACGKDPAPESTAVPTERIVTGAVVKGPLQGATVEIFQIDIAGFASASVVSGITTGTSGQFTATIPSQFNSVPLLAVTTGGSYFDEADPAATKRRINFTSVQGFQAVLPAGASSVAITPYSMALYLKARAQANGANFPTVFAAVRAQAQQAFGFDPITTAPANPTSPSGSAQAMQYALLLGASAQAINAIAVTQGRLPNFNDVMSFVTDMSDGRLTQADLNGEIARFRNNNFEAYSGVSLPTVNEDLLDDPAPVPGQAPTISDITNKAINEDTATGALAFTVADFETPAASLTVTGSSSNTTLVPNANIVLGGSGANRTVTVTPVLNGFGSATITLTVTDGGGATATDTFVLTVNPVNDPPVAQARTLNAVEDTPLSITLTATDIENDTLTFAVVAAPTRGTLSGSGATLTYTPFADANGSDSFTFKANDGALDSIAVTVSINIGSLNDAPVAVDDLANIDEDAVLNIAASILTGNDTDADADFLSVTAVANAVNGTVMLSAGTVTFTPALNYNGPASFEYTVSDGVASDTGTVNVTVTPVNDAPVLTAPAADSTAEDTPRAFSAANGNAISIADPDSGAGDVQMLLTASPLTLTLATTTGLTFTIGDGSGDSVLEFTGTLAAVNAALAGLSYTPPQDFNGDVDLYVQVDDLGNTGGGNLGDNTTIVVTVNAVNDPPVVTGLQAETINEGGAFTLFTFLLSANDFADGVDADPDTQLFFNIETAPLSGQLLLDGITPVTQFTQDQLAASRISYQHDGSETLSGSFTFSVHGNLGDESPDCPTAVPCTFNITVNPVDDTTVAVNDAYSTGEDTLLTIAAPGVLSNDTDPDSTISVNGIGSASNGTASASANGSFTYTPNLDFSGTDSFTYTAFGGTGTADSNVATVTITINPINDAPVLIANIGGTVNAGGTLIFGTANLDASDVDHGQSGVIYEAIAAPSAGQIRLNSVPASSFTAFDVFMGFVTYVHGGSAGASDSFTFTLADAAGLYSTGCPLMTPCTHTITITPAPAGFTRDFFMPYGVLSGPPPQNGCCNNQPYSSVSAVRSDDFNAAGDISITTGAVDVSTAASFFDLNTSTGIISNERPSFFVYHQGTNWFRVDLRFSGNQAPVQISSENTPTVCSNGFNSDIADISNRMAGYIVYKVPVNLFCDDPDDEFRVIRLNDGSTTAPIVLTGVTRVVNTFFSITSSTGTLQRVLVIKDGNLVSLDANFANPAILISGVGNVEEVSDGGANSYFFGIGNDLRRIFLQPDNTLAVSAPGALFTLAAGESFDTNCCSRDDDTNLYFTVPTGTQPNITNTRLIRVRRDGTAPAVEMFSFAGPGTNLSIGGVTTTKVIVTTSPGTSGTINNLLAVDKTASMGNPAPNTLDSGTNTFINVSGTQGTSVYYTLQTFFPPNTTTAKIIDETGSGPLTFSNAQWVGRVEGTDGFNLNTQTEIRNITHFLLADQPTNFNSTQLQGAMLKSYKVADGSTVTLTSTDSFNNINSFFHDGPVGLGVFRTGSSTFQEDVFAIDAEQSRFRRVTDTSGTNEEPATGDGGGGGGPTAPDADGDGLTDAQEAILETDPNHPDTDRDGFSDFTEVNQDGNPTNFNRAGGDSNPNDAADRPGNDAPIAAADTFSTPQGVTLNVAAPGVLGNDRDPDGTTPTAVAASGPTTAGGSYILNANGSFTYTPPSPGFTGPDSFTYQATDGLLTSAPATVTINVGSASAATLQPVLAGNGDLVLFDPTLPPSPSTNPRVVDSFIPISNFASSTYYAGEVNTTTNAIDNLRVVRLVYLKNGRVFVVNLVKGANNSTTQISSIINACAIDDGGQSDLSNVDLSWVFVQRPGADTSCATPGDNTTTAVRLNATVSDPGVDFLTRIFGQRINALHSNTGAITGFLIAEGTSLNLWDANLTAPTLKATLASSNAFFYGREKGFSLYYLAFQEQGQAAVKLYRYEVNTQTLSLPVYTFIASNPNSNDATSDGDNFYFPDNDLLVRVSHTPGSTGVFMTSAPAGTSIKDITLTNNRVLFDAGTGGAGQFNPSPGGVFSVLKTAASGSATPLLVGSGTVGVRFEGVDPNGRAFISTIDTSNSAVTAEQVSEGGTPLSSLPSAYWAGATVRPNFFNIETESGELPPFKMVLTTVIGADDTLKVVDPATGTIGITLGTILSTTPTDSIFGFGLGRYITFGAQITRGADDLDVYAADLQTSGSLAPVSVVAGQDDSPL